jgi:D-alanine-D-alanine ligase
MTDRIEVAVLRGGPDAERDVSLASGARVLAALRRDPLFKTNDHVIDRPDQEDLLALGADVVFPVLHGPFGEGGELQERLESAGLPYVGSGPVASRLAMDKHATKLACAKVGVATAAWATLTAGEPCPIALPLVIKPIAEGSSVGVRICRTPEEVTAARTELQDRYPQLMAEAFIEGRELTVGIVLDRILPLIEIRTAVEFYDYEAKYERDDTNYLIDPELPEGIMETCLSHARTTFDVLGCRDLARVDFMLDEQGPWMLEANTMPGFTDHSLVPMAARHVGLEMTQLCAELVLSAVDRRQMTPNPDRTTSTR